MTVALQFDTAFSSTHRPWTRWMQLLFLIGSFSALFSGTLGCWSVSFTLTPAWFNIWECSLETAGSSLVFGVLWHWKLTCTWCFSWVFAWLFDAFYKAVKCCFADSGGLVTVAAPFSSESCTLRGSHPSLGSGSRRVGQNDRCHLVIPMAGFSVVVEVVWVDSVGAYASFSSECETFHPHSFLSIGGGGTHGYAQARLLCENTKFSSFCEWTWELMWMQKPPLIDGIIFWMGFATCANSWASEWEGTLEMKTKCYSYLERGVLRGNSDTSRHINPMVSTWESSLETVESCFYFLVGDHSSFSQTLLSWINEMKYFIMTHFK